MEKLDGVVVHLGTVFIASSTKPTLFDLIIHVEFLFNKYLLSFISVLPNSTPVFDSLYFSL